MLAFYTPLIADETEQDKFTAIYELYRPPMLSLRQLFAVVPTAHSGRPVSEIAVKLNVAYASV